MSHPFIVQLTFGFGFDTVDEVVDMAQVLERSARAGMEEKLKELRPLMDADGVTEEVYDLMSFYGVSVHIPQSLETESGR